MGSPKISSNICLVSVGTLPDSSSVDVDLNRVCGVGRLMVVENEDVATQGVDPCGEHCCILKEPDNRQDGHKVLMWHRTEQWKYSFTFSPFVPALSPAWCGHWCLLQTVVALPHSKMTLSGRAAEEKLQQGRSGPAPGWKSSVRPSVLESLTVSGIVRGHRRNCGNNKDNGR